MFLAIVVGLFADGTVFASIPTAEPVPPSAPRGEQKEITATLGDLDMIFVEKAHFDDLVRNKVASIMVYPSNGEPRSSLRLSMIGNEVLMVPVFAPETGTETLVEALIACSCNPFTEEVTVERLHLVVALILEDVVQRCQ